MVFGTAVLLGIVTFFYVFPLYAAEQAASDIIRHSDIDMLSWYPPGQHTVNPDDFRKWGATLVTWGLDSIFTKTQNVPQPLSALVDASYDGGVRAYLANLDMCSAQPWNLARDAKLREAIARDFNGNGLVVPWFPAVVDGVPAYAGCINNPVYRENVRQRVREGAAAGCKGLHVDCANGLSGILGRHGGCYCKHCMEGFKTFLIEKYSRQQLAAMGIGDIDAWDFAAEVRHVAGTKQRLLTLMSGGGGIDKQIPAFRDYRQFLAQSSRSWLEELAKLTKQLGGPSAGYSINGGRVESWLSMSSLADFFTCEIRHYPENRQIPSRVIGLYRAAESLGTMLSVTAGTVRDWPYPAKGGMDNLVAMWVAFAYANGHLFIVPNNVWCYSEERGEHAYRGPENVFLPLYRFIRHNERLLDGYDPIEQLGVVYRPGGSVEVSGADGTLRRRWTDPFSEICGELVEAHAPFGVVFPAGTGRNRRFSERDLERFERVVIPKGVALRDEAKAVFESWKREGRAVPWAGAESALGGIEPLVRVSENTRVWVFPRQNTKDPAAPTVCHLFNPCYDAKQDTMIEQTHIVVSLRSDLTNRRVRNVVLYTPYEEPLELPVRWVRGRIEVTLPKLSLWGILSLK
jgi:hypothetical protein